MRALCGAIITAGALIGLGLAGVGLGTRYMSFGARTPNDIDYIRFRSLDTPMMVTLFVLLASVLVGLGLTFIGLAYHHERRHHERTRLSDGTKVRSDLV